MTAEVVVTRLAGRTFRVEVRDGSVETTHEVAVPVRLGATKLADEDLERVVRDSFLFLLEREPATAILGRFSLGDITRYFPDYEAEIARHLR